ncbi:MAG: hypothetical protein ACOCX1_06115 [Fimbriimonadaceae bacterium]
MLAAVLSSTQADIPRYKMTMVPGEPLGIDREGTVLIKVDGEDYRLFRPGMSGSLTTDTWIPKRLLDDGGVLVQDEATLEFAIWEPGQEPVMLPSDAILGTVFTRLGQVWGNIPQENGLRYAALIKSEGEYEPLDLPEEASAEPLGGGLSTKTAVFDAYSQYIQVGAYKRDNFRLVPVLWRDNNAVELKLPKGYDSGLGLVVNGGGTVAGVAANNSLFAYFLWPGTEFRGEEHPNLNLVIWFNRRPVALRHPYVDLLDPPYRRSTIPTDINENGDVVGQTHTVYEGTTHDRRAFAYSEGRLFDLNRSFQEEEVQIKLTKALGIADDGSILAEGVRILGHPDEGETAYVYLQPTG